MSRCMAAGSVAGIHCNIDIFDSEIGFCALAMREDGASIGDASAGEGTARGGDSSSSPGSAITIRYPFGVPLKSEMF